MAAAFPQQYEVAVAADGGCGSVSAPPRPPICGGAPPQFDGTDRWWSPEELLLGAVGLCQMITFAAFAKRAGLPVATYASRVAGRLDKTAGGLLFTAIRVSVNVTVAAADVARAEQLVQSAKKHCIISNCLKVPVELECSVRAA